MSTVTLVSDDSHWEERDFLLYKSVHHPRTVGFTMLLKHNHHINWSKGRVIESGENCVKQFLDRKSHQGLLSKGSGQSRLLQHSQMLLETQATLLSSDRPYDSTVDLLPGAPIPKRRLSVPVCF